MQNRYHRDSLPLDWPLLGDPGDCSALGSPLPESLLGAVRVPGLDSGAFGIVLEDRFGGLLVVADDGSFVEAAGGRFVIVEEARLVTIRPAEFV